MGFIDFSDDIYYICSNGLNYIDYKVRLMADDGHIRNPKGNGGFGTNPQNRADGRWTKETSISYFQNLLIRMEVEEFKNFIPQTIAQQLAYESVKNSAVELVERKELQDRTEGKAQAKIDVTTQGESIQSKIDLTQYSDDELRTIAELQCKGRTGEA